MIALAFLLVVSIVFNIMFFYIITDNQKHISDKIEELNKKIHSKDNNLEIKKHFK
jgi:Na+/melibiose symporter-like transporter